MMIGNRLESISDIMRCNYVTLRMLMSQPDVDEAPSRLTCKTNEVRRPAPSLPYGLRFHRGMHPLESLSI
jgi:hypothetical protein